MTEITGYCDRRQFPGAAVLLTLSFDPMRIFDAYCEKGEKGFYLLALSQSEPCRRTQNSTIARMRDGQRKLFETRFA